MQTRFYASPNGIKIHFLEFGSSGPDVVLVPGITSPAMVWAFVARELAAFCHVYVLDNRGRGLSDQRPGLTYTLDDYAADTAGVIGELSIGPAVVLGHSMGGRIAIRTAAKYPDVVKRLLLADPPLSGPGRRPYPLPMENYLGNIDAASRGQPLPVSRNYTPEQNSLRTEWVASCSREAVIASHRGFQDEDVLSDLPKIACPAFLLYAGEGDTIRDTEAAEVLALIPRATKRKLDGIGHMMPWFDLKLFVDATRDFLLGR